MNGHAVGAISVDFIMMCVTMYVTGGSVMATPAQQEAISSKGALNDHDKRKYIYTRKTPYVRSKG